MKTTLFLLLAPFFVLLLPSAICKNVALRPTTVNIGAIFTFNSTIGRAAKVAVETAIDDVNNDPSILRGTKLVVQMRDSNCSSFIGTMEAMQFMETDTVAIIGPQSSVIAHVMSVISTELRVPLVSFAATDPTLSSLQYPFFVRATQSDLFQMTAIAEIIDFYLWREVVVIYIDDEYGRNGIASLGDKLSERSCKIIHKAALSPTANTNNVSSLLVKISMLESRIIVLHANPNLGLIIFSEAESLDMMGTGYVWIATDWLTSFLDSSPLPLDVDIFNTMQGVIALRQHTSNTNLKKNLHLNAYGLYAYDTVWLIARALDAFLNDKGSITFSTDPRLATLSQGSLHLDAMTIFEEGDAFLNKIKSTNFTGVTGLIQFDSNGYILSPAYDIINVIGSGMRTVGYWTNYTGLSKLTPEKVYTKPANRSRVNQQLFSVIWPGQTTKVPRGWVFPDNGKGLRIVVPKRVSYQEFVSQAPGTGIIKGFCIDVFTAAVNLLPYAVPSKFVAFGNGLENPLFDDLVNTVVSDKFDAAVGDISITMNRAKIVDFTQPFVESDLVILAPMKKRSSNAWAFLKPFTAEMWCVTCFAFLIVGAVIWVLEHRINDQFRGPPKKQLVTIIWFSFSTLFFSHRENTMNPYGRIVLIIWLFVVLIIQSSYTASLTSILTVQQLSSPIKGIESLINSKEAIGYQVGSFAENYMVEELGISRTRLKSLGSIEEYRKALDLGPNNGGVAAIVDERPYVDLFLSTECDFGVVGSGFTRTGWGFVFPRDSPLATDMSTAILALSESGDLQRIRDKWLTRSGACASEKDEVDSNRLQLSSFWGLFLLCALSCIVSVFIFVICMICKFLRAVHPAALDSSGEGSSSSTRSFRRFLSFVYEVEEVSRARRKQIIEDGGISNGFDVEK